MKDQLFMLKPGFFDGDRGPLYCGDSVPVEGLLGFFPHLREAVDVHYIEAKRPRAAVVALIGAENQSIPVIVLAEDRPVKDASISLSSLADVRFINNEADIRTYLSTQYDAPLPG